MANKEFSKETIEHICTAVKDNSYSDGEVIVLGEIIELKPFGDERGTGVDVYKYVPQEEREKDDDYDYDSDYLTTIYF